MTITDFWGGMREEEEEKKSKIKSIDDYDHLHKLQIHNVIVAATVHLFMYLIVYLLFFYSFSKLQQQI